MRLNTLAVLIVGAVPGMLPAQGPPPPMSPRQLEDLVSRIALYPDPLLAQVLAAATYADQIPDADMWANQHKYLRGDQLARAISEDRLPFDPSVQSLLPFPEVLHMMTSDPGWTRALGDAFLSQRGEVIDAVQRMRRHAYDYGYLRSNPHFSVLMEGPQIIINPYSAGLYYVPIYNPGVVYYAPRPGFVVGSAIGFGAGFAVGAAFAPWGWGGSRFDWGHRSVYVNNREWSRSYVNRTSYVHPYEARRYEPAGRVEGHRLEPHEARHEEHHEERRDERRDERRK
jgi:hypothetical protein